MDHRGRTALVGVVVLVALAGGYYASGEVGPSAGGQPTATQTTAGEPTATDRPAATDRATATTTRPATTVDPTNFSVSVDPALGWVPPYVVTFKYSSSQGPGSVYVTGRAVEVNESEQFEPLLEDGEEYRILVADANGNSTVLGTFTYRANAGHIELTVS